MWSNVLAWYNTIKTIGFLNSLVEFDKYVNHEWLNGNHGETISSRLGRYIEGDNIWKEWSSRIFCRTVLLPLGIIMNNKDWKHCRDSIQEKYRK